MLKWLRKYNTWILVIGGVLLMIAFLLPQALMDLGKSNFGAPVFRFAGTKVSPEKYQKANAEHHAMRVLLDRAPQFNPFIGDNTEHWIMLTHEAEQAGLVGGPEDGKAALSLIADELANSASRFMQQVDPAQLSAQALEVLKTQRMPNAANEGRLTEEQMYKVLSKFQGVLRLRASYYGAPRYSEPRLIGEARKQADSARLQYVVFPAERDMLGINPTEAEVQAHYETFKDVVPGTGVHGFGYRLPNRVKLAWLTIDKASIRQSISPDAVEVQKRFLKAFPSVPAGTDEKVEREKIQNQIKDELTEQILRTADQAVRGEVEKVVRSLQTDGAYRRLPEKWNASGVDWNQVAQVVESRVMELHKVMIARPTVKVEDQRWLTESELAALPGIGTSTLRSGQRQEPFAQVIMQVREISGDNLKVLQTGIPSGVALTDMSGNHYFFTVLAARKPSAPDALNDVRQIVVNDLRRLGGFDRMSKSLDFYEKRVADAGIDSLAGQDLNLDGPAMAALQVRTGNFDSQRVTPSDDRVDVAEAREVVAKLAATIDPLVDIEQVPVKSRIVVTPLPKQLGLLIAKVNGVSPMTQELFRQNQNRFIRSTQAEEFSGRVAAEDPFTFAALTKRLKADMPNAKDTDRPAPIK